MWSETGPEHDHGTRPSMLSLLSRHARDRTPDGGFDEPGCRSLARSSADPPCAPVRPVRRAGVRAGRRREVAGTAGTRCSIIIHPSGVRLLLKEESIRRKGRRQLREPGCLSIVQGEERPSNEPRVSGLDKLKSEYLDP